MSSFGSGKSLKSEIDRVRSKLLGSSYFGTEECGGDSPGLDKEERVRGPRGQENIAFENKALSDLNGKERITETSGVDALVLSQPEKRDGGERKATMANQFNVDACHEERREVHGSEESHGSECCGTDDRLVQPSATFSACHSRKQTNADSPLKSHATQRTNTESPLKSRATEQTNAESPLTSHATTESPLAAVEVSMSANQQCGQFVSRPAQNNKAIPSTVKEAQQHSNSGHVTSFRRNVGHHSRSTPNLSKTPISVITLKAASNGLCECGEMLLNKGLREDTLTTQTKKSDEKDLLAAASLGVNSASKVHPETETKCSEISQEDGPLEATITEREHPAVRRRLSTTIRHLQEKIQKEIENNENKSLKEIDIQEKPFERKRTSTKLSNRFVRERSRKRSKSRVGFKVLQSARKYPQMNIKERPYRQWMTVGNCVTYDSRYIVSSNCPHDKMCLAKRNILTMNGNVATPNGPLDITSHEDKEGTRILANMDEERKKQFRKPTDCPSEHTTMGSQQTSRKDLLSQSNKVSDCTSDEGLRIDEYATQVGPENIQKPYLDADHMPCSTATPVTPTKPCSSEPGQGRETCSDCSLRSSPPTRERSRCIRRSSLYADRRIRPPTPHSDFSSGNLENSKLPSDTSNRLAASRKRTFGGTTGSRAHVLSVSTPGELKGKSHIVSEDQSPLKSEFDDILRISKRFTAAPKQQRKAIPSAQGRKKNGVALQSRLDKSSPLGMTERSPCGRNSATSEDTDRHGSLETLWSDVSTTTWESSIKTESSSSWYRKDVSGNHDNAALKHWRGQLTSEARLARKGAGVTKRVFETSRTDRAVHTRKYVDVQALVDFKGALPGQLNFRKGQIIKQMVSSSPGSKEGMSYGYYRAGPFKRKRKGLFPSTCVTHLSD